MPLRFLGLAFPDIEVLVEIEPLCALRRNDTDLVILGHLTLDSTGVVDRVDMQLRRGGFPRQFAKALNELFLQLIRDIILFAEEDDTALRH
jgi:hypothetical protein